MTSANSFTLIKIKKKKKEKKKYLSITPNIASSSINCHVILFYFIFSVFVDNKDKPFVDKD